MHLPLRRALAPLTLPGKAPSSLPSGLVSYWKLEEASGSRASEVGGFTLTDVNTVTGNPGKIGNAGQFTAANVERLDNTSLSLSLAGDFTVSAWIYPDSLAGASGFGGRGVVCFHNGDAVGDWWVGVRANGSITGANWENSGIDTDGVKVTSTTPVTLASWQHVAFRKSSGAYTLWHNGASQSQAAPATTANGWGTNKFSVGTTWNTAGQPTFYWDGRIDEVGIWSRGLTDSEMAALYNGGSGNQYPFS